MKVWALFSIANNYDQPDNNLEGIFEVKPTSEELARYIYDADLTELDEDTSISLVDISKGKSRMMYGDEYRLRQIEIGKRPDKTWE